MTDLVLVLMGGGIPMMTTLAAWTVQHKVATNQSQEAVILQGRWEQLTRALEAGCIAVNRLELQVQELKGHEEDEKWIAQNGCQMELRAAADDVQRWLSDHGIVSFYGRIQDMAWVIT